MLSILAERHFPAASVRALASERSRGRAVPYNGSSITLEAIDEKAFKSIDVALFAASTDIALMYAPIAAEAGALVVDNSSAWRMKENVPLVVPEVNREYICENEVIIANPN
jgi:aspartate-semialdehyde dehydrogenase